MGIWLNCLDFFLLYLHRCVHVCYITNPLSKSMLKKPILKIRALGGPLCRATPWASVRWAFDVPLPTNRWPGLLTGGGLFKEVCCRGGARFLWPTLLYPLPVMDSWLRALDSWLLLVLPALSITLPDTATMVVPANTSPLIQLDHNFPLSEATSGAMPGHHSAGATEDCSVGRVIP